MSDTSAPTRLSIVVDSTTNVSALWLRPHGALFCFILAHGAGAGMDHPFMSSLAEDLANYRVASLRYQFPYIERGARRPDDPKKCHATIRAAVATAHALDPNLPLYAGGKSFGGRMTSQAQAISPMAHLGGLIFIGFPLHAPRKPATARGAHLLQVAIPMLFLQGMRDDLADVILMQHLVQDIGQSATLVLFEHADHSFHVLRRSGMTDAQVRTDMLMALTGWAAKSSVRSIDYTET